MYLVYVWYIYEDIDWSNILHSTMYLRVKVMDRIFIWKFYIKVFRFLLFKNPVIVWFKPGMKMYIGPKFYPVPSPPPTYTQDLIIFFFILGVCVWGGGVGGCMGILHF